MTGAAHGAQRRRPQGIIQTRFSTVRKDTTNWIALADYDIETARHMLATGRYLYVIFLCHLAPEKLLKAHVAEVTQTVPIKTHDLIYLVKKCELELPENHLDFIGKINTASIPTRYRMTYSAR